MLGFGGKKASDNGPNSKGAHVVVIGNEKGGSGKSTTTMHMIVALLQQGRNVASIDVDARQGTLSRYIANRERFVQVSGTDVEMPDHYRVEEPSEAASAAERQSECEKLRLLIEGALINHDVVLIDTPGSAGLAWGGWGRARKRARRGA